MHETDLVAREAHVAHNVLDNMPVVAHKAEECERLELDDNAAHRAHGHLPAHGPGHDELARGKEQRCCLWVVDADRNCRKLALVVHLRRGFVVRDPGFGIQSKLHRCREYLDRTFLQYETECRSLENSYRVWHAARDEVEVNLLAVREQVHGRHHIVRHWHHLAPGEELVAGGLAAQARQQQARTLVRGQRLEPRERCKGPQALLRRPVLALAHLRLRRSCVHSECIVLHGIKKCLVFFYFWFYKSKSFTAPNLFRVKYGYLKQSPIPASNADFLTPHTACLSNSVSS